MLKASMVAAGLALALSACGASKKECGGVDWQSLGRSDGAQGLASPSGDANYYLQGCPEAGVAADRAAYDRGRVAGLGEWCGQDWRAQGARDGGSGAAARNAASAEALCKSAGASFDSAAYQASYETAAKRYCGTLDWQALGRKAAEAGKDDDAQASSPAACKAVGVRPDVYAYHRGYEDAMISLCDDTLLYKAGMAGKTMNAACPRFNPDARAAFGAGAEIREIDAKIASLEADVKRSRSFNKGEDTPATLKKSADIEDLQYRREELVQRWSY